MEEKKTTQSNYISTAVVRALKILTLFNEKTPSLSLAEISKSLGVNRTVPYRIIYTLENMGYLKQDKKTKRYELTPKVLELGFSYLQSFQLTEISRPYLEKIRDQTNVSAHLGILDGDEVVYIAKAQSLGFSPLSINIGARTPAYATSIGKVLLAYLPEEELNSVIKGDTLYSFTEKTKANIIDLKKELNIIREQEYAMNIEEYEIGIHSIAVPVFQENGQPIAAINVAGSSNQLNVDNMLSDVLPILRKVAKELSYYFSGRKVL